MADGSGHRDHHRDRRANDAFETPSRRSTGSRLPQRDSWPLPPPEKRDSFKADGNIKANTGSGSFYDINSSKATFIERAEFNSVSHREWLLEWLKAPSAAAARDSNGNDFSNYLSKMAAGTGDWLLKQNKSYLNWSSSKATAPAVLWLYGDAGFGKSVLCAHAISDARRRAETSADDRKLVVAYQFYVWDSEPETVMTAFLNLAHTLVTCYFDRLGRDKATEKILRATADTLDLHSLQSLIKCLVREFAALHLFIDGLDELVDAADRNKDKARWAHAETFLDFVLSLAMNSCSENGGGRVKVWITSQERHRIRRIIDFCARKGPAPGTIHIPLQQKSNQSDIAVLFEEARKDAMNPAQAQADLDKLQTLVGSNFLWARWMLDDFAKPRIDKEENLADPTRVPQSFAEYLRRRIRRQIESNPESRLHAAYILSCLVYAKRPLRVEELRDAVSALRVSKPGGDICVTEQYDPVIVKEICAPFVCVDLVNCRDGKPQMVCRLYHASVKGFLMKNPYVLQDVEKNSSHDPSDREQEMMEVDDNGLDEANEVDDADDDAHDDYAISPQLLARACLRYLQQARFRKPLKLVTVDNELDFVTADSKPGQEQSVNKLHFFAYAAKYWARHLQHSDLHYSYARKTRLRAEIEQFVRSPQFHTMLQVQSIFVRGQFSFWYAPSTNARGFVRAFPSFFAQSDTGVPIQKQYQEAIQEWGYFLDKHSCHGESYAGRIDLCLWGTLGENHVLYPMRRMSRWSRDHRSYKLELKHDPTSGPALRLCFHDNLQRLKGGKTQLFSVKSSYAANAENVEVDVEVWTITPDLKPEMDAKSRSMIRPVAVENLELYERPLKRVFHRRPRAVAISSDGRVLRVGPVLFIRNEGSFKRLSLEALEPNMDYFVEMNHREHFLVLARRGNITRADLTEELDDSGYGADQEDAESAGNDEDSDDGSGDSMNSTPRSSVSGSIAGQDETDGTQDDTRIALSTLLESETKVLHESGSDFESAGNESSLCSARESYSEGSTTEQSDVIRADDEFWSNWPPDGEPEIEDLSDGGDWASPPEASENHDDWDSDIASHLSEKPDSGDPIRDRLEDWARRLSRETKSEDSHAEVLAEYDGCPDGTTAHERVRRAVTRAYFVALFTAFAGKDSDEEVSKDVDGNLLVKGRLITEEVLINEAGEDIEEEIEEILESEQADSDDSDEDGGKRRKGKNVARDEDSDELPEDFDGDWLHGDSSSENDNGPEDLLRGGTGTRPESVSQNIKSNKDKPAYLCELVVLNMATATTSNSHDATAVDAKESGAHLDHPLKPIRTFRFACKSKSLLFASPPAIHPTRPLLVWPIGGGDIVFAHFSPTEKTFFTRNLGGGDKVCHISMQVRFSPEGRHLHIACLDGTRFPVLDEKRNPAGELIKDLLLRVSTYRLSRRKTARSPPQLIYQTSCPLQRLALTDPADGSISFQPVPVAPLPWTLSWEWGADDWGHVYACQSSKLLRVVRLPLFAKVEASDRGSLVSDGSDISGTQSSAKTTASEAAFTNKGQVFLPSSADNRRIHFIPFSSSTPPQEPGGNIGEAKPPKSPESKKPTDKSAKMASSSKNKADSSKKTTGGKSTIKAAKGKKLDKSSSGKKRDDDDLSEPPGSVVATLVLSSEDAMNRPSDGIRLRTGRESPDISGYSDRAQVVYLRASQFGGWAPLSSVVRDDEVLHPGEDNARSEEAGKGGTRGKWMAHLKDKVEKFDRNDDCDIADFIQ